MVSSRTTFSGGLRAPYILIQYSARCIPCGGLSGSWARLQYAGFVYEAAGMPRELAQGRVRGNAPVLWTKREGRAGEKGNIMGNGKRPARPDKRGLHKLR